jgi:hypothetical protein
MAAILRASVRRTAQQLMVPQDSYLLRDRDGNYGEPFRKAADWMGIKTGTQLSGTKVLFPLI